MSGLNTRNIERDSLFLMADVRIPGEPEGHRVKVRNLSGGGMMAEGSMAVQRGACVSVELRNVGSIDGSVVWVQKGRFGIAFAREIDPRLARAPAGDGEAAPPRYTRPSSILPPASQLERPRLRKI